MVAVLGYALIIVFMFLIMSKRLSPFIGLIVVPIVFGLIVSFSNDMSMESILAGAQIKEVLGWVREGVFFKLNKETVKVAAGTVNTAALLLFAILYFSIMLNAGLFDPLCSALIKSVKGDPLKITIATALIASVVALDGDGTTTVLIVTAATLTLYKKMGMKMKYLAMLIVIPNSILNFLPWGGPLARVMSVLELEVTEIFPVLVPAIIAAMLYVIFMAYMMGMKERKRLGYVAGTKEVITSEDLNKIIYEIQNKDIELKRPKLFWFNLIMSALIMYMLIAGLGNGAILFMIGTAFALMVNYPNMKEQRNRIVENGGDALGPVIVIFAAGCLMGILNGSGMSDAIALNMVSWIPEAWGAHIPAMFSVVALPGLVFLSNDAFYFGILPVVAPIAYGYGATALNMGVAAMLGQALHFASPLVPFIYILIDRCEISFGEYQKEFVKWAWPIFVIYVAVSAITGAMPL